MNLRWVLACGAAESWGIAAAAGAAAAGTSLQEHEVTSAAGLAFALVVAGGVVEGLALGGAQAYALRGRLDRRRRARWWVATLVVAGLGWGLGSAPAALGAGSTGPQPTTVALLGGAAALGAAMGALLGLAQAWAAGVVRGPWTVASCLGWTVAMPVVFLGATTVGATLPWTVVVLVGALTGLAAGLVLGLVTAPFLDSLRPRERDQGPVGRRPKADCGPDPRSLA